MKTASALFIVFALGVAYMMWLDNGCKLNGVMTWSGKMCAENL